MSTHNLARSFERRQMPRKYDLCYTIKNKSIKQTNNKQKSPKKEAAQVDLSILSP